MPSDIRPDKVGVGSCLQYGNEQRFNISYISSVRDVCHTEERCQEVGEPLLATILLFHCMQPGFRRVCKTITSRCSLGCFQDAFTKKKRCARLGSQAFGEEIDEDKAFSCLAFSASSARKIELSNTCRNTTENKK